MSESYFVEEIINLLCLDDIEEFDRLPTEFIAGSEVRDYLSETWRELEHCNIDELPQALRQVFYTGVNWEYVRREVNAHIELAKNEHFITFGKYSISPEFIEEYTSNYCFDESEILGKGKATLALLETSYLEDDRVLLFIGDDRLYEVKKAIYEYHGLLFEDCGFIEDENTGHEFGILRVAKLEEVTHAKEYDFHTIRKLHERIGTKILGENITLEQAYLEAYNIAGLPAILTAETIDAILTEVNKTCNLDGLRFDLHAGNFMLNGYLLILIDPLHTS